MGGKRVACRRVRGEPAALRQRAAGRQRAKDYLLFAELMLGSTEKREHFLYILNGLQADVQRSLG